MKTGTKSFLKQLGLLACLFVGYVVAVAHYRGQFAPDEGVHTFKDLQDQGIPMTEAYRAADPPDHICVLGDVDRLLWTLPSGPPAYLFDASGNLVDFTLDIGDSTRFQSDYDLFTGDRLSLEEVEFVFHVTSGTNMAEQGGEPND